MKGTTFAFPVICKDGLPHLKEAVPLKVHQSMFCHSFHTLVFDIERDMEDKTLFGIWEVLPMNAYTGTHPPLFLIQAAKDIPIGLGACYLDIDLFWEHHPELPREQYMIGYVGIGVLDSNTVEQLGLTLAEASLV